MLPRRALLLAGIAISYLLPLCSVPSVFAQAASTVDGDQVVRYHDDARWADPGFDDSEWPVASNGLVPSVAGRAADSFVSAMNQCMLARSRGGFTTCLTLRADIDGTLTVANAGQVAPYVNGKESALENGFPLGLSPESAYVESTCRVDPGAQITLLTDGIVEARNDSAELFGFDRTAVLSTQSAGAIARAAQAFGQKDDISVLTLRLESAEAAHA